MKKTQLISWSLLFKQRFITVPVQKSISWAGCVWAPTVAQRLNICGGYRSRMHRMQIGKSIFQSAICIQHAPVGCALWQHGTSHKMSATSLMWTTQRVSDSAEPAGKRGDANDVSCRFTPFCQFTISSRAAVSQASWWMMSFVPALMLQLTSICLIVQLAVKVRKYQWRGFSFKAAWWQCFFE